MIRQYAVRRQLPVAFAVGVLGLAFAGSAGDCEIGGEFGGEAATNRGFADARRT